MSAAAGLAGPAARAAARIRRLLRLYVRFAPLLARQRQRLLPAAACMLGAIAAGLLAPWPVQMVIDGVLLGQRGRGPLAAIGGLLPESPGGLLAACCFALLILAGLRAACAHGQNLLAAMAGHDVVSSLRVALFDRLQRLSLVFHQRRRTGDLLVRLTGDVAMLREILVPAGLEFVGQSLLLLGMLSFMFAMDATLTLIALAMLPLLAVVTARYGARLRRVAREQRRKEGRIATVAGEALASVAVVQAYSNADEMSSRFTRQNRKSLKAGLRALRLEEKMTRTVDLALAAASALVLGVGALRSLGGSLSPGELIVFLTYLRGIYRPVQILVRLSARASKALACGDRILEIFESGEEVRDAPDAVEAPRPRGEILFDRVTFGYDAARPVLHEVSFRIAAGEKVGLVGPSGAGKSTVLALLLRLYDPQQGRILVDGRDIRSFTHESHRRQIAVVLQDPFLFGVSVGENIRYGRLEATAEEIRAAARAAGADDFISRLKDGYDTVLGERGASLSRGQQQRLGLARAVVRDAPILVLDEPTTGLDAPTEAEVLETLSRLGRGRTCLWIAHDLGQILSCPRVLVLRDGRLVEQGGPAELLERAGAFQALFGGGETER